MDMIKSIESDRTAIQDEDALPALRLLHAVEAAKSMMPADPPPVNETAYLRAIQKKYNTYRRRQEEANITLAKMKQDYEAARYRLNVYELYLSNIGIPTTQTSLRQKYWTEDRIREEKNRCQQCNPIEQALIEVQLEGFSKTMEKLVEVLEGLGVAGE